MRILHISDTHGMHKEYPEDKFKDIDLVIYSGDCANYMSPYLNEAEVRSFLDWYKNVPVKQKIFVAGNHDTSIERRLITKEDFSEAGVIYLENEGIEIEGIKFWGSPYSPKYGDWSFMKSRETINRVWELIPEDTEVLIVHGPPKTIRDMSFNHAGELEFCGCNALLKKVNKLPNLKLVAFGHIHNSEGVTTNQGTSVYGHMPNIVFSNAACVFDGKFRNGLSSFGNIIEITK